MTDPNYRCVAADCIAPTSARRPFCERHWKALPGRLRGHISLSMSFGWSPLRDEMIARAARALKP